MTPDPKSPLGIHFAETAGRKAGMMSPTAMLSLDSKVENILRAVAELMQAKHSIDEIRAILQPEDVQLVRQEYERLQRLGETQLDAFVENILRPALMDGQLPGIDDQDRKNPKDAIRWQYHVIARCPEQGVTYENIVPMTRKLLERYRGLEYLLADEKAHCNHCNTHHEADVSFTEYVPRSYEKRFLKREEAEVAVATWTLAVKKAEAKGTNTKHYQVQKKHLKKAIEERDAAAKALADWERLLNIYRLTARVKGSSSFIYKVADKVTRLDYLVPDEQKQEDERASTCIKDYLGVTIEVTNEATRNIVLNYLTNYELKDPANFTIIGRKDYWGPPRTVPQPDGSNEEEGRKENSDGSIRHEAYHLIVLYAGMPIEVQILQPNMKVVHEKDHKKYKQRLKERRRQLQEEYGIDYDGFVGLLEELLGQRTRKRRDI